MLFWYLKKHKFKQLANMIAEQYLGALFRAMPGYEGMVMRRLLYGRLFAPATSGTRRMRR